MLRILIADDHEIVRQGLKQILLEGFSFVHIEEASDGLLLADKALSGEWDVVVSDLAMPGGSGLEALRRIKEERPGLPVLILSIHSEEQYAISVMKAGADGYLNKNAAPEELVNAVQRVLAGRKYISGNVVEKLGHQLHQLAEVPLHELLSSRELDVFRMLSQGRSVTEISQLLDINTSTVSTYRSRILEKMNIQNNAGLTRYAIEHKLI